MQRTTVMIPSELKARAIRCARDKGISLGELLREALALAVENSKRDGVHDDALFADTAVYDGDVPADLSEQHDHYLYGPG